MEVKKKILETKKLLSSGTEPTQALVGKFNGETALVVSAGPSMKYWRDVYEMYKHLNPVIVCVKQAYDFVGTDCDICFLNNGNLKKYNFNENVLTIFSNDVNRKVFGSYDVLLSVYGNAKNINQDTMCALKKFEDYTLANSGTDRLWGPGIMHEAVFFTLLHIGITNIITIGWDIANDQGLNSHGYNDFSYLKKNVESSFKKNIYKIIKKVPIFRDVLYKIRNLYQNYKFNKGDTINKGRMEIGEAELISSCEAEFIEFLSKKGVDLNIYSDSNWHDNKKVIPTKWKV